MRRLSRSRLMLSAHPSRFERPARGFEAGCADVRGPHVRQWEFQDQQDPESRPPPCRACWASSRTRWGQAAVVSQAFLVIESFGESRTACRCRLMLVARSMQTQCRRSTVLSVATTSRLERAGTPTRVGSPAGFAARNPAGTPTRVGSPAGFAARNPPPPLGWSSVNAPHAAKLRRTHRIYGSGVPKTCNGDAAAGGVSTGPTASYRF